MEKITFPLFILMSIPDTLLLVYLGLGLTGSKRPPFRQLLILALINALFSFVIRNLSLPPGIHLIFQVPFMILSLMFICKFPSIQASLVVFLGVIFLMITQTLMGFLLTTISGMPFRTFLSTTTLHLALTIPSIIGCALVIFIVYNWKIVLFDIQTLVDMGKGEGNNEKN